MLNVVYEYGEGKRIEFSGPVLGADDLRVLQGLVAMAGPDGLLLGSEPVTEWGAELRHSLMEDDGAIKKDAVVVKGSYRALAREVGYKSGNTERMRDCIKRLFKINIIVVNGKDEEGFHLLSGYRSTGNDDSKDGSLCVALNPMLAKAVMGGRHSRIEMSEVRALESDQARLIHQRLCGWINPGENRLVGLKQICEYIWPNEAPSKRAEKYRRKVASDALKELSEKIGWKVKEYAKSKFEIFRPEIKQSGE
jgi:hypothetical protein